MNLNFFLSAELSLRSDFKLRRQHLLKTLVTQCSRFSLVPGLYRMTETRLRLFETKATGQNQGFRVFSVILRFVCCLIKRLALSYPILSYDMV